MMFNLKMMKTEWEEVGLSLPVITLPSCFSLSLLLSLLSGTAVQSDVLGVGWGRWGVHEEASDSVES